MKHRGLSDALLSQALDEDLYDVIQVSPKEKPVAALSTVKHRQKNQIYSTIDEQPKRPPKSNRMHEVSTVHNW